MSEEKCEVVGDMDFSQTSENRKNLEELSAFLAVERAPVLAYAMELQAPESHETVEKGVSPLYVLF